MLHQATVTYTRPIIRRAAWRFWVRYTGWRGFGLIAFCLALFVITFARGDRSWFVGAMGAVGWIMGTLSLAVYLFTLRRSLRKFDLMKSKSVQFIFTDERFSLESDLGKSEIFWTAIERIWRFPGVWLIFFARANYMTLPTDEIDEVTREFILERVKQHGGRVK